jgi:DNA-binding response OmpR family regulator
MHVLLIEDDPKISGAIAKSLRAEGFAVDVAADGIRGEQMARSARADAIILDIMLPGQDGWTTLANLRRDEVSTPILILTALADVSDRIAGLDRGADDYLVKPFHFGELLARIRSLARRPTEVRTAVVEKFGVLLDPHTRTATRNGRAIALTAREFALLELFMHNPGRILSRGRISEYLWDMNTELRSNVIDAYVKLLRQKIDRDADQPLIHTVRGAGYLFRDKAP